MKRLGIMLGLMAFGWHSAGVLSGQTAASNATSAKTCTVTGHVRFLNPTVFQKYNMVWLRKGIGRDLVTVDSVPVGSDGNFQLTLKGEPGLYQLDVLKWQTLPFWSDADVYAHCRGYDTSRVKAKNSGFVELESQSEANRLINIALHGRALDKQVLDEVLLENLRARQQRATDSTWYQYLQEHNLYRLIEKQSDERLMELVQNHPKNPAKVLLLSMLDSKRHYDYLANELRVTLMEQPDLEEARLLRAQIEEDQANAKKALNGSKLPTFVYPTPNGKTIALTGLKGKYFIVDFWASWCGPCRKSIPKLKELYTLYHTKGLEILSISIDTDQTAWRTAMTDEAMPWPQALSPDKDKTLKDFNLQGVPTMFLVDREGRIVEKFTGYNVKLETMLKTLF